MKEDRAYVEKRNALIPQAERLATYRYQELRRAHKNRPERMTTSLGKEFSLAMTELAVKEGLVNEGMLDIFHAKRLPQRFIK